MITKKELRKTLIRKRKNLPPDYRQSADKQIFHTLTNLDTFKNAKTIFCYVSKEDEVDTHLLIKHAIDFSKRIVVPKCVERGIMHAFAIQSFDDLIPGKYGILEPKEDCELVCPSEIDFAIVPCLSCNSEGYRLGYGGGFYDRYLQERTFIKAAICYNELLSENIPVEEFDQKVDLIISA